MQLNPYYITIPDGIKPLNNNKAAGLDDIICEQIKNFGLKTLLCVPQIMNIILVSHKFPKLWRKSKVIAILKPQKILCITKELHTNFIAVSHLQIGRTYDF